MSLLKPTTTYYVVDKTGTRHAIHDVCRISYESYNVVRMFKENPTSCIDTEIAVFFNPASVRTDELNF